MTDAVPAEGVESAHDKVQLVAVLTTCNCEDVQVKGVLVSTTPPSVLGSELLPMISITVATAVCEDVDPLAVANVVRPEPTACSSRAIFSIGQLEKKSRTGAAVPWAFVTCGCWNEVLLTPLAVA